MWKSSVDPLDWDWLNLASLQPSSPNMLPAAVRLYLIVSHYWQLWHLLLLIQRKTALVSTHTADTRKQEYVRAVIFPFCFVLGLRSTPTYQPITVRAWKKDRWHSWSWAFESHIHKVFTVFLRDALIKHLNQLYAWVNEEQHILHVDTLWAWRRPNTSASCLTT